MKLEFNEFSLTIEVKEFDVPYGLKDEVLYLTVKDYFVSVLEDSLTKIFHFGYAPDNTADNQDELLTDGVFFRIIGYEKNLGIDLESSEKDILKAFHYLLENYKPFWSSIFVEEGLTKKEITIELLYQDVF